MIASLPMYDRPETAAANDALWSALRDALGYGPERLSRAHGLWEVWESPDLLFSQTCGLPYRARLHGKVTLIGCPDFGLPGCPPGHYNSVLITRADHPGNFADLAAQRVVVNQTHSQSGCASILNFAAARGITIGNFMESGAHVASARRVAEGAADLAAIDAHTWRLICRYDEFASALREVGRTDPTPAMPYITHPSQDAPALRAALESALAALPGTTRDTLGVRGIVTVPAHAFLAVPTPAALAG